MGYVGAAADGEPLMVQSTGMGGPSAAIVLEELCDLGVTRAVRVGTCGGLDASLELGDLVVAHEALCADGTSRALGAGERTTIAAPGDLAPEGRAGLVVTTDLFYDPDPAREDAWRAAGALAVEMETAALFAVGARRGIAVASVLAVSDLLVGGTAERALSADCVRRTRRRLDDEGLVAAGERVGRAGAAALLRR